MIKHTADNSRGAVEHTLGLSNLILFFSLPFKPAGSRNLFLNGHIALFVEGTIYQVYDPKRLKVDFLFSRMPASDWLFGDGGSWVYRNSASPRFTHVYLYGKCESRRTIVYYAGVDVASAVMQQVKASIFDDESRFGRGDSRFNILANNCSSITAAALNRGDLVEARALNRIPALLFKSFVTGCAREYDVRVGKFAMYDNSAFELHRYCIGTGMTHPEKAVDRWIVAQTDRRCTRRPFWPLRSTAVETEK